MKGLILTMTCGEGHNAVARSLKTAFEEKNVEIEVVDIFKSHPFLHKWNNEYYFLGKKDKNILLKVYLKTLTKYLKSIIMLLQFSIFTRKGGWVCKTMLKNLDFHGF